MPRHKPVPQLLDISLNGICDFIDKKSQVVARKSYFMSQRSLPGEMGLEQAEKRGGEFVDSFVQWLQTLLFTSVPWYHYQSLVDVFLCWLTKAVQQSKAIYRRSNSSPECIHKVHVLVRFVHLVVHPRVRTLDFSKLPKILRDALYKKLDALTGLEILNLGSGNGESGRKRSFMNIKTLANLQSLTLVNDCQNETLALIAQNCSQIRFLDISSSGSITEQGTSWLLLCPQLEHINLYQTSQSVQGYAQLLQGLKNLKNIGRCDAFGQVLEYLEAHRSKRLILPLTHFHSRDMNYEQLQLLVIICPNILHINLYVDEDVGNLLSPVGKLVKLKELKLLACNFYSDRVDRLLEVQGDKLTMLHLEHVDELDMSALCFIAETCPNLEKLVFFSCDFVENFGPSHVNREFQETPFQKLDSLICVSESAPNVIEFLLANSKNLKSVQFGSTAWFNDEIVAKVLKRNALKLVEEIRILRSYELTMSAVRSLIGHCPNLKILAEMDGWEGIGEQDLAVLRNQIRRENWDLDTFITWSVTG